MAATTATTTMLQKQGVGPPSLMLPSSVPSPTPSLGPVFFRLPRYAGPSQQQGSSTGGGEGGLGGEDGPPEDTSVVWWPGVLERTPWNKCGASSSNDDEAAVATEEEDDVPVWFRDMGWVERLRMTEHQIRQATTGAGAAFIATAAESSSSSSSAPPPLLPSLPSEVFTVRLLGWHRPAQASHYVSDVATECLPWEPGSVDKAWTAMQRTSRPSRVWKRFKVGIRKATTQHLVGNDKAECPTEEGAAQQPVGNTATALPPLPPHPPLPHHHHHHHHHHQSRSRVSLDVAENDGNGAAATGVGISKAAAAAATTPAPPVAALPNHTPQPAGAPDRDGAGTGGNERLDGTVPVDPAASPLEDAADTTGPETNDNDDDENPPSPPPVLGPSIDPHDAWTTVWGKLEYSGWNCRYDFDTNTNLYAKPGHSSFSHAGAQPGRDYFDHLVDLQAYVKEHYQWVGPEDHDENYHNSNQDDDSEYTDDRNPNNDDNDSDEDDNGADEEATEERTDTVAVPSTTTTTTATASASASLSPGSHASNDDSFFAWSQASSPDSQGNDDRYVFRILLSKLKARGWKYKRGTGLQNFVYVPPAEALRRDPTLPPLLDSEEAVIAYCKAHDQARGYYYGHRQSTPPNKQSRPAPTHQPKKLLKTKVAQPAKKHPPPTKKTAPTKKGPGRPPKSNVPDAGKEPNDDEPSTGKESQEDPSTRKRGRPSAAAAADSNSITSVEATAKPKKKKARRKPHSSEAWYKTIPVPSDDEVWPHLEALGFRHTSRGYHLPKAYFTNGTHNEENVAFPTLAHVRKFLAKYGMAREHGKSLKKNDRIELDRWIAFANVPVNPSNSVWRLSDLSSTLPEKQLKGLLIDHGFHTMGGCLYLPGADAVARGNDRKRNVHFFDENDVERLLRPYLRGAWAVVHTKRGGPGRTDSTRGQRRGVATLFDTEPASDVPLAVHVTPLGAVDPRKTLQLRLWAATSPLELPVFRGWPSEAELRALLDCDWAAEEADLLSSGGSSNDEGSDSDDGADSTTAALGEKESVMADAANDNCSIGPESTVSEVPRSARSSMSGPLSDWECVWPALEEQFGFEEVVGGFTHANFGGKIMSTHEDLAKCLCKFGIPRYQERKGGMDKAVRALLLRWVTRAFVRDGETIDGTDDDDQFPTSERCLPLLRRLGWEWLDGTFFAPWSNGDNRTKRVEGVHKFIGEDKLRVFLRSSDVLGNHDQLTHTNLHAVRVWAANVDSPLPTFCPATFLGREESNGPDARGRSGSRRMQAPSLDAVIREWANSVPIPKPTPKVLLPKNNRRETRIVSIDKPSPLGKGFHSGPRRVAIAVPVGAKGTDPSPAAQSNPLIDDGPPVVWMTQYDNDPLLMDYGVDGDGASSLGPEEPAVEEEWKQVAPTLPNPTTGPKPGSAEPELNTDHDDNDNIAAYHDAYQAANDFLTQQQQREDSDAECGNDDQGSATSKDY